MPELKPERIDCAPSEEPQCSYCGYPFDRGDNAFRVYIGSEPGEYYCSPECCRGDAYWAELTHLT